MGDCVGIAVLTSYKYPMTIVPYQIIRNCVVMRVFVEVDAVIIVVRDRVVSDGVAAGIIEADAVIIV